MFLALFGFIYLREKVSIISFLSIILAMSGIIVMIGDSISSGTLFGNIVALTIPISFSILIMIIRKNPKLDLIPAIWFWLNYISIASYLFAKLAFSFLRAGIAKSSPKAIVFKPSPFSFNHSFKI